MAFGAGDRRELRRVLILTVTAAEVCAVAFLLPVLIFPRGTYGLLVGYDDVVALAVDSNVWLLPVLLFAALAYAFDGFFVGLTQGKLLSRSMVISLGLGFAPLAWAAVHFRDSNLLWLSMVGMMAGRGSHTGLRGAPLPVCRRIPAPPEATGAKLRAANRPGTASTGDRRPWES